MEKLHHKLRHRPCYIPAMETITTLKGVLIPADKILELRPEGDRYTIVTLAGRYAASADAVLKLIKPPRAPRKAVTKKTGG